jgi:hypothetical protein
VLPQTTAQNVVFRSQLASAHGIEPASINVAASEAAVASPLASIATSAASPTSAFASARVTVRWVDAGEGFPPLEHPADTSADPKASHCARLDRNRRGATGGHGSEAAPQKGHVVSPRLMKQAHSAHEWSESTTVQRIAESMCAPR